MQKNIKENIRKEVLARRRGLSEVYRKQASEAIMNRLCEETVWQKAVTVFLYYGYKDEVQTERLILQALSEGKKVYLPRVISDEEMAFLRIQSLDDLESGAFGIKEPPYRGDDRKNTSETDRPDIIVVPCVAVSRDGNRIGHGKGYYDRYLSLIGDVPFLCLAFDCQLVGAFEAESMDIRMDTIITEHETIRT
ncbi:MAG: 5-formyltetrahydrofolate cyclo-ligase [Lachnospiraceae bacterium]|nr:5-formyltetrahydrofolate cyclo-ligase [Lachnospiraceae bacterium]